MAGLVFTPHASGRWGVVATANELASALGARPAVYSGGEPKELGLGRKEWDNRKQIAAEGFTSNQIPHMVATRAFGMGIDMPNIRWVIHNGMPGSIEEYYQQVGRAGRDQVGRAGSDRQRAECILLLILRDEARARRLVDSNKELEELRAEHGSIPRDDDDDVTHQLWFLLNSWKGMEFELRKVEEVLHEIGTIGSRRLVKIPIGGSDPEALDRERAIYRLRLLGVVSDYRVEISDFVIELGVTDPSALVQTLQQFVEKNSPGRIVGSEIDAFRHVPLQVAAVRCAKYLIDFIYGIIEKSRRRSLGEMLDAALRARLDDDRLFRERILSYLEEGNVSRTLERLAERKPFSFSDWELELYAWQTSDAGELRGAAARLLISYPDQPGLLAARSHAEALDPAGDLNMFGNDLEASLRAAVSQYGSSLDATKGFVDQYLRFLNGKGKSAALAQAIAVARSVGLEGTTAREIEKAALRSSPVDPALAALALASALESIVTTLDDISRRIASA